MNANLGDKLKCISCGHTHLVTQSWLDGIARRFFPTSSSRMQQVDELIYQRLKCEKCGQKEIEVVPGMAFKEQNVCWSCAGDGGLRGNCQVCGGTGYLD